ncbi:MAG TPA: methyltransferase [Candidatus Limnocylindrales bacterium]
MNTTPVSSTASPPLGSPERSEAIARIRSLLERADYSAAGIAGAGVDVGLGVRATDVPTLRRALAGGEPVASLVRLFVLGDDVPANDLERRIGRGVAALEAVRFVERRGEAIVPLLRLTPWRGFVVAHDADPAGELWPTHVAGPTPAGDTLADLTVRRPVATALDIGSGSGVLSLLAARHAMTVVATDLNPAAIAYTALNAELNGLANIETREGDLFEPVGPGRHDLIVSNPPFVIAPDTGHIFRHSSLPRDHISRAVVRGAAERLTEGGFAHVLCNWISAPGAPSAAVVDEWVAGTGCDALILIHGAEDPLAYAIRWNLRAQQLAPAAYPGTLDRWLAYFAAQGIESVTSGAIILRRRNGSNWRHTLEIKVEKRGPAGEQIEAVFRAQDYLATVGNDQEMLDARFAVDAPHRLDQALVSADGGYVIESATLVLQQGVGIPVAIDPDLIPVLLRFDGSQTVGEIVAEVAEGTGVHRGQLTARTLRLVRTLLEGGFAEPRSADDGPRAAADAGEPAGDPGADDRGISA